MNKPKILIKIIDNDGKVKRVSTKKSKRIYRFLKADNFLNSRIFINISYREGYKNQGEYLSVGEALLALKAFLEVEI